MRGDIPRKFIPPSVLLLLILTCSLPIAAESSFFGSGEQNENECPIMSFTCDETPGVLEMIYLDDGIYFQETNDVFPPIGILRGGHDMVKLGILVDENGEEVDWSDLTEAQKANFEEEHGIIPPKENTNATRSVGGASDEPPSSFPSPTNGTTIPQLDPSSASQQPPVQDQVIPQDTQVVTTNTSDAGNTRDVGQGQPQQQFQTYRNPTLGISIQYPSDWELLEESNDKLRFIKQEGFVTADLNVEDIDQSDTSLSEYANTRVNELRTQRPEFQLVSNEPVTISNKPAQKVVYTFEREEDGKTNKVMRIWSTNEDKLYTLAYIAESG